MKDFVDDLVENENAPDYIINGVARIERVNGTSQIRIYRYVEKNGQKHVAHSDVMDVADYHRAWEIHLEVLKFLEQPAPNGGTPAEQERRRGKH